jgi:hypothetical protein
MFITLQMPTAAQQPYLRHIYAAVRQLLLRDSRAVDVQLPRAVVIMQAHSQQVEQR